MNNRLEIPSPRRLACSGCGVEFDCNLAGGCWCTEEAFRLPMPTVATDCLCPNCLRKMAAGQQAPGVK
jgi:hypothetical protein